MAKRATPGVDVFIDWGTLRWGGACNWYPGFSPGTHKESTHTENDPNYAAESEAGLRLHIGAPKTANRARTTWALERSWRVISFGRRFRGKQRPGVPQVMGRKAELRLLRYPLESANVKVELGALTYAKQTDYN